MTQVLPVDQARSHDPEAHRVYGRFAINKAKAQKCYLDLANDCGATNFDSLIQAKVTQESGAQFHFSTAGDAAEAKSELDLGAILTNIDTVIRAATAGTPGDLIKIQILTGAAADAGSVTEDTVNKRIVFQLKDGGSDLADFETLVGTCTLIEVKTGGSSATSFDKDDDSIASPLALAGGADACYLTETVNGGQTDIVLHFTDGATTVTLAETALGLSSYLEVHTAGTGASTLTAADDTIARTKLRSWKLTPLAGEGWWAYRNADGDYRIVFLRNYRAMAGSKASLIGAPEAAPGRAKINPARYSPTTKTATLYVRDFSVAAAIGDGAYAADTVEICFETDMVP